MKLIETNSDGRYGYEDSLSLDTGGRAPEPIPSAERVKEAIRMLEVGWWEGLRMRVYYTWRRNQLGRVFWISGIVSAMIWVLWTMGAAAFDWLWKGLGIR